MKRVGKARVSRRKTTRIVGTLRDTQVLSLLAWLGYLDTRQVERAAFPSRRTAQRRLRALLDHGLIKAQLNGEALHKPNIWSLTELGCDWLVEHGGMDTRPRPGRVPRTAKLGHALSMREAFLAYWRAERAGLGKLLRFAFDDELAQQPGFQAAGIIPDGLAEFHGDEVLLNYIEYDAGNERHRVLREKLTRWAGLLAAQQYQNGTLIILVDTRPRARALQTLVHESGVAENSAVVVLGEFADWLAARCTHTRYAPPVRAARTPAAVQPAVFAPLSNRANRGFRPLVRGK